MIDSKELKPCPFCPSGGDVDGHGWLDDKGNHGPQCLECGATAESAEKWNTRPAPGGSELVERVEKAYRDWGYDPEKGGELAEGQLLNLIRDLVAAFQSSRGGVVITEEWLKNNTACGEDLCGGEWIDVDLLRSLMEDSRNG